MAVSPLVSHLCAVHEMQRRVTVCKKGGRRGRISDSASRADESQELRHLELADRVPVSPSSCPDVSFQHHAQRLRSLLSFPHGTISAAFRAWLCHGGPVGPSGSCSWTRWARYQRPLNFPPAPIIGSSALPFALPCVCLSPYPDTSNSTSYTNAKLGGVLSSADTATRSS